MKRISLYRTISRLATVAGIVAGLFLFAGPATADEDGIERPFTFAFGVAPGSVSVNWEHSGAGVAYFTVTRDEPRFTPPAIPAEQRNFFDSGLQPDTAYRYYVCAYFYDGYFACSDWSTPARTLAPAPAPGGDSGGAPPALPAPAPGFTPELRATPAGGAQVNLSWTTPPAGSIVMTSVPLYRDGEVIYEALQPGNLDSDYGDPVTPNTMHRYQICYEGPAIGERCSAEVVAGPTPIAPTAPADLRVTEVLLSGGRTESGIFLRPKLRIDLEWRNTEIPGVYLTVEREDSKVGRDSDPNSPVELIRQTVWSELARLKAADRPTSASVDAPDPSAATTTPAPIAGDRYRVCAVVPALG